MDIERFEYLFRGKFLFMEDRTIHDVIDTLRATLTQFEEWRDAGVTLRDDGSAADDYLYFETTDSDFADKFGFEPVQDHDDDNDEEAEDA
jgi:hypothetical protein